MTPGRIFCLAAFMAILVVPTRSLSVSVDKNRPVSKVIVILKDMLKTMQKEGEEDENIYDKLACWCDVNEKVKTKTISEAEKLIPILLVKVQELIASVSQLTVELEHVTAEKTTQTVSLDKAIEIRRKELVDFTAQEKDLFESIAALKAAIAVLSKHHSSLLQMPQSHLMGVAASIQHTLDRNAQRLTGVLTRAERHALSAFIQQAPATRSDSYGAQGGQIYGILVTMKEQFEKDLAGIRKDDNSSLITFQELKYSKTTIITSQTEQIMRKTQELAEAKYKLAQIKLQVSGTRKTLAADQDYLAMLKDRCEVAEREWDQRQKTRAGEMEAVSKALAILSSDESHDLFTKTFNAAFLQKDASEHSVRRDQASKVVAAVARKLDNPTLATLSVAIRLDAFTRVKKAIDDMVAELTKEQKDEEDHRNWCVDELHKNEDDTITKDNLKSDTSEDIEGLQQDIKKLTADIDSATEAIADSQKQIKIAGEDREKANTEFQAILADQRDTQKVLGKALTALDDWYNNNRSWTATGNRAPSLLSQAPPAGFEVYKDNAKSGGVMNMLETIINDAKSMEKETIRSEEDAQKAYEDEVKETNAGIEAFSAKLVDLKAGKAKKEEDLVEAEKALEDVTDELEILSNYKAELGKSCGYILKNFDVRQTARTEEIDALKQAKTILSGGSFIQLLKEE